MLFQLIDDILALLGMAKYFSTIYLKSVYWQVAFGVVEEAIWVYYSSD